MKVWGKRIAWLTVTPVLLIIVYLGLAVVGGLIPVATKKAGINDRLLGQPVYLVANMLHADIAIPVNSMSLQQFAFLRNAGIPLDNPELKYLIVGWGSKAFYTSTKDYSDMELGTIWKAATGDSAVLHVAPAGELSGIDDIIPVRITENGFARLLKFVNGYFRQADDQPVLLEDATFGYGDVFYESPGHFNVFNPCNIWVSNAMREAGLAAGLWTPTTYSLLLNHHLYN
ncbi:MAG: TIGR02117 family protein [Rhizobiaceae bacterium]